MLPSTRIFCRFPSQLINACAAVCLMSVAHAGVALEGRVVDDDERPLHQAQVTAHQGRDSSGATAVTVFTDVSGRFAFPQPVAGGAAITVRALGFKQISPVSAGDGKAHAELTIRMQSSANQVGVAPASAWLRGVADPIEKAELRSGPQNSGEDFT